MTTCLIRMRNGYCLLENKHKGRHSTSVFVCKNCLKKRRGHPLRNTVCFLCKDQEKKKAKALRKWAG